RNLALYRFTITTGVRSNLLLALRKGDFVSTLGTGATLTSMKMTISADASGAAIKGVGSPVTNNQVALVLTFSNRQVLAGPLIDDETPP
ncbi:MAG: hypothetical protein KDK97_07080, partial [Verrucomicrobiales bacterium]|nr:hypothetical protein [Verrucomicrobiales bacterium]